MEVAPSFIDQSRIDPVRDDHKRRQNEFEQQIERHLNEQVQAEYLDAERALRTMVALAGPPHPRMAQASIDDPSLYGLLPAPERELCRVPDIPIRPHESIPDAWTVCCLTHGWGGVADSPEAAAVALVDHLSAHLPEGAPERREPVGARG